MPHITIAGTWEIQGRHEPVESTCTAYEQSTWIFPAAVLGKKCVLDRSADHVVSERSVMYTGKVAAVAEKEMVI